MSVFIIFHDFPQIYHDFLYPCFLQPWLLCHFQGRNCFGILCWADHNSSNNAFRFLCDLNVSQKDLQSAFSNFRRIQEVGLKMNFFQVIQEIFGVVAIMQKSILSNLLAVNNVSTSRDRKYKIYFIAKLITYLHIFYLYYLNFFTCIILKENVRNFQKLLTYFLCDNICSENFLCYHKTCFSRKT